MAEHPMFPLWTDAYLADTQHLSCLEHGAYLLLLMAMWRNKGWLPNDDVRLSRYARIRLDHWRRIKPVLMEFFEVGGDRISQARLLDEYESCARLSKLQAHKAKARWLKTKGGGDAAASSGQCLPFPSPSFKDSESIRKARASTETPAGVLCTIPTEDSLDLDAVFFRRGKQLLGPKSGGQLSKLRAAVGLGQALQIIDDAQRKDSPAEYVAACIRKKGNGYGRRPSAVQDLWRDYEDARERAASSGDGDAEPVAALCPPAGG